MRSLISIPAYLLKNTLHRWFENPGSPATKLLVPFLFAAMGLFFFGLLQNIEAKLSAQLARAELRAIRTQEVLFSDAASARLANGTDESFLWEDYCESYDAFQQVPLLAVVGNQRRIPVLSYDRPPSFFNIPDDKPGESRPILLLTNQNSPGQSITIDVIDHPVQATTARLPDSLADAFQVPAIAVFPIEFLASVMQRGYTEIQVLIPNKDITTAELEALIRTHAQAEDRSITIQTSLSIIAGLDQLLSQQQKARLLIGAMLTLILSLTLGSLSLLEFRQESYLIALLRSFGIRPVNLFVHYLLETSILTFSGIYLAIYLYTHHAQKILEKANPLLSQSGSDLIGHPSSSDYRALLLAAGLGVIISAIPIALGLRKQPGLLLP